jgi:hypothetical protein
MSVPETLDDLPRRFAGWAVSRSLAPVSVAGISVALAVCAAGWFSAGTRPGNVNGALALVVSYVVGSAARQLAGPGRGAAARRADADAHRLADWCATLSEYAVYAGLAVGGYEQRWGDTWQLAVAVMIVQAVRKIAVACSGSAAESHTDDNPAVAALRGFLSCPPAGRIALITLVAPIWGARATLLVLLEWGIIATGYALTGRGPYRVPDAANRAQPALTAGPIAIRGSRVEPTVPVGSADEAESAAWVDSAAWVESPVPDEPVPAEPVLAEPVLAEDMPVTFVGSADPDQMELPPEPGSALDLLIPAHPVDPAAPATRRKPDVEAVADPQALATMAACRDDGTVAVWLGRVVRGEFVPLPPAVAGLAATSLLAWLGMRELPGVLLFTPLVVMLLAAFGSRHPHDGRMDWLTPAVLLAGQLLYFAALGFAFGVPPPVTFAVCGLTALHYLELATRTQPETIRIPDTKLGWEGRMFIAGIGAVVGFAAVAYLALAAYLVLLIAASVLAGRLVAREGGYG